MPMNEDFVQGRPALAAMGAGFEKSVRLYEKAKSYFPYGTQLFSRRPELGAFGEAPIFFERAKDAHFWDVDGNEFIDLGMGIGPVTLGYCYDAVDEAVKGQLEKGVLGTVNNAVEVAMAKAMAEMVPCAEMMKFCKGGGEADAIAVRIARGYTGRDVVVFCGYHGWHDWYLAANLESEEVLNKHLMPGISPKGVPRGLAGTCVPFEYNNLDSLRSTLEANKGRVACIIMEASRFKQPAEGFLEGVRELADAYGCVLIFDEVVTGFRLSEGGAQEYYGITPDLAAFGKAIANGYPLGAVAGRREVMESASDNFISSTYWSDTLSLAAGVATLKELKARPVVKRLWETGTEIVELLKNYGRRHGVNVKFLGKPCSFHVEFDYGELSNEVMTFYCQEMAARGVYASSVVYTCFTHTDEDLRRVGEAADESFGIISKAVADGDVKGRLRCPVRKTGFRRLV